MTVSQCTRSEDPKRRLGRNGYAQRSVGPGILRYAVSGCYLGIMYGLRPFSPVLAL